MTHLSSAAPTNPFFQSWDTPFGVPPFDQINIEHFLPAVEKAIEQHRVEINHIATEKNPATFQNTLVAYDSSGGLLKKVTQVFMNQSSVDSNDQMQSLDRELTPLLSAHQSSILLDENLFDRIQTVYEQKDSLNLNTYERKLLEDTYKDFVRGGALLSQTGKKRVKEIKTELSSLTLKFGQNVLNDTNSFEILIDDRSELEGLSGTMIEKAAADAEAKGLSGKFLFIANRATVEPVTTNAHNRSLREKLFKAYIQCADRENEFNNNAVIKKILELRIELANLLGYPNWSAYALDKTMAGETEKVLDLSLKVWEPALEKARQDVGEMQVLIDREGGSFKLEPWDYRYYAEKIRKERYNLSAQEIKPYFLMENVRKGVFALAEKLYGVKIEKRENISVYHPDVDAWEVMETDGTHIGIFLTDYYARPTKQAGAWMSAYRSQWMNGDENVPPIVVNVCNFTKPTGGEPCLLSLQEVDTMFHEFGHATHGLFSKCQFYEQAGTSVPTDFVELPSMLMENWALEPELLKLYATHFETGEVIPDELLQKIQAARTFNEGFATVEYVAAVLLDMEYHSLDEVFVEPVSEFENTALYEKYGLIPEIVSRYRSTFFQHIFAGGYSSKYYAYLWSEVLDADAFSKFKEDGLFNRETAASFRKNVLSKGGSDDPMKMYLEFRGHLPQTDALLKRKGFL
ncbi:MAG: M3 family metallopeptidase [Opitutales bacterium]|nr:M3 family metallopeptidase [Opitutales bacterium]